MRNIAALVACLALGAGIRAEDARPANDPQFHKVLLNIAAGYLNYGRADHLNRWAPELCQIYPGDVHASRSKDSETHGGKLYFIYAKNASDYMQQKKKDTYHELRPELKLPDDGGAQQVLVKQSWKAQHVEFPPAHLNREKFAVRDGKYFQAGEQADLFIMIQFAKDKAGTDEGWVYGTVTADGKTVTSSGKVQSCMSCHVEAPRHRVFGLPGINEKPPRHKNTKK